MTFAEKYDRMMTEMYGVVGEILICPECGNGLSLDIPDDWGRMDMWGCDDCQKAWSVDELEAMFEEVK